MGKGSGEGRPKITKTKDLASAHVSWSEAQKEAQDRTRWRKTVETLRVAWLEKDR